MITWMILTRILTTGIEQIPTVGEIVRTPAGGAYIPTVFGKMCADIVCFAGG